MVARMNCRGWISLGGRDKLPSEATSVPYCAAFVHGLDIDRAPTIVLNDSRPVAGESGALPATASRTRPDRDLGRSEHRTVHEKSLRVPGSHGIAVDCVVNDDPCGDSIFNKAIPAAPVPHPISATVWL